MRLTDVTFTVFDVETTGLDPRQGHRIVEIAGVRLEGNSVVLNKTFSSLVNPERDIPSDAGRLHGLGRKELTSASTITEVLPCFLEFAKNSVLIAHNAQFDMGFLEVEKDVCWGYIDLPECLCTMSLSRSITPREAQHSLNAVALRLGVPLPAARHRALADALLTAQVFLCLLQRGHLHSLDELRRAASPQLVWR